MICQENSSNSLNSQGHPFFLGIALSHSLIGNEEISQDPNKVDAVLDFMALLQKKASPFRVIRQFYKIRSLCERKAYLSMYRLRKWLESEIFVSVDGDSFGTLDLTFKRYDSMVSSYQRKAWEKNTDDDRPENVWVRFQWINHERDLAVHPLSSVVVG